MKILFLIARIWFTVGVSASPSPLPVHGDELVTVSVQWKAMDDLVFDNYTVFDSVWYNIFHSSGVWAFNEYANSARWRCVLCRAPLQNTLERATRGRNTHRSFVSAHSVKKGTQQSHTPFKTTLTRLWIIVDTLTRLWIIVNSTTWQTS